jgi:hypothetical protein
VKFGDFVAAELGTRQWVIAPRLTTRLRDRGYDLALSPARYIALETEWQRRTYGAPLGSLRDAAPDMLAELRNALDVLARLGAKRSTRYAPAHHAAEAIARVIAKAEGKPCDP